MMRGGRHEAQEKYPMKIHLQVSRRPFAHIENAQVSGRL